MDKILNLFYNNNLVNRAYYEIGAVGKDAIQVMLRGLFTKELLFTRHMVHMPLIEIDGDEAVGKWYLDCPSILGNGEVAWTQGTY